jgi:hypothetical protein
MTRDGEHQRRVARRMIAHLSDRLGIEHVALALRLSRAPRPVEFAEHARPRFRADPKFGALVIAAQARVEAEDMVEWREHFMPAPIEGGNIG